MFKLFTTWSLVKNASIVLTFLQADVLIFAFLKTLLIVSARAFSWCTGLACILHVGTICGPEVHDFHLVKVAGHLPLSRPLNNSVRLYDLVMGCGEWPGGRQEALQEEEEEEEYYADDNVDDDAIDEDDLRREENIRGL